MLLWRYIQLEQQVGHEYRRYVIQIFHYFEKVSPVPNIDYIIDIDIYVSIYGLNIPTTAVCILFIKD